MEGVNPFIKNNKHRMIMFLDELGVSEKKKENSSTVFWPLVSKNKHPPEMFVRTSPTCPKPPSTLGQTCPGTWPLCTRCAPCTRTSCGR